MISLGLTSLFLSIIPCGQTKTERFATGQKDRPRRKAGVRQVAKREFPMQYEHPLSGTPMHRIDIDSLSEEELIELNHKVVARLRFLNQMRSHSAMLDFRIGERVKFHPTGSPEVTGILTRYNKKTVTVVTDSGQHWNVAPGLLSRMDSGSGGSTKQGIAAVTRFPNRAAEE